MRSTYNPDEVRKRIRDLRKEQGWTQEELADKCNVSWNTIAKIECGLRSPSVDLITILSEVLETTVDYLVRGILPEQDIIKNLDESIARIDEEIAIFLKMKEKLLLEKEQYQQKLEMALS